MEDDLIARLLAASGVTALAGTQIYPGTRPQGAPLPAITVNRISGAPTYHDQGETGLAQARMQIDCWGATYKSAKETARVVTAALSAFHGTVGNTVFQTILLDDERDDREDGLNAPEYLYRRSLDFIVWYET